MKYRACEKKIIIMQKMPYVTTHIVDLHGVKGQDLGNFF